MKAAISATADTNVSDEEAALKKLQYVKNSTKTKVSDGKSTDMSDDEKAEVTGRVHVGDIMVDGLGVGDVGNIVLRDRQHLAEDGIIIVVLTLESGSGQVLAGPYIVSR